MTTARCNYRAATLNEVAANVSDGKQGNKPPDSAKRVPHNCETVSPKLRNWFPKTANNRPSHKSQHERSMPIGNCSRPDDANWTGAEIKSCCRLASLLDVPLVQAAQNVVPVAETAATRSTACGQMGMAFTDPGRVRANFIRSRPRLSVGHWPRPARQPPATCASIRVCRRPVRQPRRRG